MNVAVVVVSYGVRAQLVGCLRSIRTALPGAQTVVVDNASEDGSAAAAAGDPDVRLIALRQNLGFSAAVNRGVAACDAPFILLLNPDATLPGACHSALLRPLREDPGVWAAGYRQVDQAGYRQLSAGPRPTLTKEWARRVVQRQLDRPAAWCGAVLDLYAHAPRQVGWVAGSSLLVRRSAFVQVAGFDEQFFLYFEDIDFCLRLQRAGGRVVFDPRLTLMHARGRSAAQVPKLAARAYRDSQAYFWRKHHGCLQAAAVGHFARWRGRAQGAA